tara:strand:+ start:217 stop:471 length:255 start_codon:yes stop_codon:yes gene_type:complete
MDSSDKIDNGLENLDWHVDMVFYDSIKQLANDAESRNDYIFTDEITLDDKLIDLDELIQWGENKEMYTECQVLLDMKKEIIANQ